MKFYKVILAAIIATAAIQCSSDDSSNSSEVASVQLALIADDPANPGDQKEFSGDCHLETFRVGGVDRYIHDARFFLHDIELNTAAGYIPAELEANEFQYDGLVLIDLENGGTSGTCNGDDKFNDRIRFRKPSATVTGIRFKIGVPQAMRETYNASVAAGGIPAPAPLNTTGMYWSWTTGYKHTKIETRTNSDKATPGETFNFHLGANGCTANAGAAGTCTNENIPQVTVATLDPSTQKLALDLTELFFGTTITGGSPNICMAGAGHVPCRTIFPNIGVSFTSNEPATYPANQRTNLFVAR